MSSAKKLKPEMTLADIGVPLDLQPMEAKSVTALPTEQGWQFEPKWDGFRCLAFRAGDNVELRARSGKSLSRFFPEVLAHLRALKSKTFVLDGELVTPVDATLSFDALQARLHPAESRIKRLATETPATLVAFDCLLRTPQRSLLDQPFLQRRSQLENFFAADGEVTGFALTPYSRDRRDAERWLSDRHVSVDGVVAKKLDLGYRSGQRAMFKVKHIRTADCVVGGFRYESGSKLVGSLLLGLFDDEGLLHHVGFTSALSQAEKPALTKRLEKIIGLPGFTGDAPGGPSRWSNGRSTEWQPLKPLLVVEVRYDHVTSNRFRHGTGLVRWRPDKAPAQCTFDQMPAPTRLELAGCS